jgi:hypothetical protein
MGHWVRTSCLTGLLTIVSGCAQIPTHELSQYRTAFAEVQTASETILIDFDSALTASKMKKVAASGTTQPALFSRQLTSASSAELDAVEVRRTALRTIDKFNNVLTTLAEGKSVEAVRTTASGFVQAAQNFVVAAGGNAVPGLSAITGGVQDIIAEIEKARLRKEFEKAVRAGAPTINKILDALYDERSEHLDLRRDEANLRHVDIMLDITTAAAAVRSLVHQHGPPAPPAVDPIKGIETALNEALKPAQTGLTSQFPVTLSYTAGQSPLTDNDQLLAQQMIAQIKARAGDFQSNVQQYEALRKTLEDYGALLRKARDALSALVGALDKPQNFEQVSDQFFALSFTVKKDIEAYRAARKTVN